MQHSGRHALIRKHPCHSFGLRQLSALALSNLLRRCLLAFPKCNLSHTCCRANVIKSESSHNNKSKLGFESDRKQSIFNLPQVELWASERGLHEHHLKTIYNVVMHASTPDFKLEESLIAKLQFPRRQASTFANDFTVSTCQLVESAPIQWRSQNGDSRGAECSSKRS
jgi:hypothetical protein